MEILKHPARALIALSVVCGDPASQFYSKTVMKVSIRHVLLGLASLVGILLVSLMYMQLSWTLPVHPLKSSGKDPSGGDEGLTIRVNTFKRLDLLEVFVDYYLGKASNGKSSKKSCDLVKQIQVVWSDIDNIPPKSWIEEYGKDNRLVFETHEKDSLNNRFMPTEKITTEAVVSVDDDLIIPCDVLAENLHVWRSFDKTLVGFSPRIHAYDAVTGAMRYLRWQHTWWSGFYSIMLTKASFLHRDYFELFSRVVPKEFLEYVDKVRNCEDIAMAHVVASHSKSAPVWVGGEIYEIGSSGISSNSAHFTDRGQCLETIEEMSSGVLPWIMGYSKVVAMNPFVDYWYLGA